MAAVKDSLLREEMEIQEGLGLTTTILHAAWFDSWRFRSRDGNLRNLTILVPFPLTNSGSLMILLSIILVHFNLYVLQQKNLADVNSHFVFSCLVS